MATTESESPAATMHLMEEVCERENLVRAWQRVRDNKGAPGSDGMTIEDAKSYLSEHWPAGIPILGEWPTLGDWMAVLLISVGVYFASGGPMPEKLRFLSKSA